MLGAGIAVVGLAIAASIQPFEQPPCTLLRGNGTLDISVANLARGHARFFCYQDAAGKQLRFLLARGEDGKVRSVFDACRQCYKYHEGYTVSGDYLVCRFCGTRYKLNDITHGEASCVPVRLNSKQKGNVVAVKTADLEKERRLF